MMKVSHYFTASLTAPTPAVLYAVKGDGARMAVIRLMAGAEPWPVPEGVTAGVSYTLPDKAPGYYDRLEDGAPACMIAGNLVSAVIAPVLTGQAGTVKASIVLRDADGGQVATFPFQLRVEQAPGIVDAESVPAMGSGFEGKLFYGGPGGALTALALGDGVRVEVEEDGTLVLVAEGGSGGGGGIDEEEDPTVPAWAKQPQKPAYTAQEVGALPEDTKIPGKTSELTNDAGFVGKAVNDLANYYTKQQTQELISAIPRFRVTVAQQLPAAGEELVLYLVPFATAEGQYLEYIWAEGRWEIIGSQRVDLTGYATEEWVQDYVEEHSGQNVNGLTAAQIAALDGMFKVAAYIKDDVSAEYNAFKTAFGIFDSGGGEEEPDVPDVPVVKTYTVSTELVNVTSNNGATSVDEGASYTATLTASDGYTLEGATVTVTMGGVDVTASVYANGVINIPSVTGTVEIIASAVQIEGIEAVLPNGYTAYFDFRNNVETSVGAGNLYMCHPTEGEGHLYSWHNVFEPKLSDEGIVDVGNNTYAKSGPTAYAFPEAFTYCGFMKNHESGSNKVMLPAEYVSAVNSGVVLKGTYYKADGGKASTETIDIGKHDSDEYYVTTILRVNGTKLDIFVNGELCASFDGSDYDGFSYWSNTVGATLLPFNSGIGIGLALYEKALTDVEVEEAYAYFKTLEVA